MNHSEFMKKIESLMKKYPEQTLEEYFEYIRLIIKIMEACETIPIPVDFTGNEENLNKLLNHHQKNMLSICLPFIEMLIKNGSLTLIKTLSGKEIISPKLALETVHTLNNCNSCSFTIREPTNSETQTAPTTHTTHTTH